MSRKYLLLLGAFVSLIFLSSSAKYTLAATDVQVLDLIGPNYTENGQTYSNNVSQSGNGELRFSNNDRKTHYLGTNNPNSSTFWAGNFESPNYPSNYIIESAYLEVVAGKDHTNPVEVVVYAENDVSPDSYSNNNKPGERTEITSGNEIAITENWIKGQTYQIDVTDAVSEMFDNGFIGGVSIILKNAGDSTSLRYVYNDYDTSKAPKLVMNFSYPDDNKELRVLEVRYFANPNDIPYHPDLLDAQLEEALEETSGYKVNVNLWNYINHNTKKPTSSDWQSYMEQVLADNNLCQKIKDDGIDMVWMWVDTRVDSIFGVEYAVSNPRLTPGVAKWPLVVPTTPFCNGESSFTFMALDYTRTYDLALHSMGHMMEGLAATIQGESLFNNDFSTASQCGNIHFPPNGTFDYDYSNSTVVTSYCDSWQPGGGTLGQQVNCTAWNCNHEGYMNWWWSRLPVLEDEHYYQNKQLPTWYFFMVDMDQTLPYYYNQGFWMDPSINWN